MTDQERAGAETPAKRIGVLLTDDHTIFRQGLAALLAAEKDIEVIGEASTGTEAVEMTARLHPSVVIMDIALPDVSGLVASRLILDRDPEAHIIILSMSADEEFVSNAMDLGIKGYLVKQTAAHELITAIREINKGNAFFSPSVSRVIVELHRQTREENILTMREREILRMVAQGKTSKDISTLLCLSPKSVERERQHIMEKLDLHDAVSLTRYAIAKGITT
jgi:DNA-binding NarL/FixJ family response regulator